MPASDFFKRMEEYGRNPKNGYMDNVFLDIVKQKQRLDKPLTQEEQEFLDNADANPNIRKNKNSRQ